MMDASHTLPLSQSQVEQLAQACAAFRSYAWQYLEPSEERNRLMKAGQAVQGRLAHQRVEGSAPLWPRWLTIAEEERRALCLMLSTLMRAHGAEPDSPERNQVLGDLAALRVLLERGRRHTQV